MGDPIIDVDFAEGAADELDLRAKGLDADLDRIFLRFGCRVGQRPLGGWL